jgi:hypothetical protein
VPGVTRKGLATFARIADAGDGAGTPRRCISGGGMAEKAITTKAFWAILVSGMLTGMGNGSVFGAAMMCLLGRGGFADWGGPGAAAYDPATFTGFIDWAMLVFGFAFVGILWYGLTLHDRLERAARA